LIDSLPDQAETHSPLTVFAAGSLEPAFRSLFRAFARKHKIRAQGVYGPSGSLRARIEDGEECDLFASANLRHPEALTKLGIAGPVAPFAHNELTALANVKLKAATASILDRMLDPGVRLGTSTPKADPSGDYAWLLFRRADVLKPGSRAILSKKARRLRAGPKALTPPAGASFYRWVIESGEADIFLTYVTNALPVVAASPKIESVPLPPVLSVGADYGLTVVNRRRAEAWQLAMFILGIDGRRILAKHGFEPPRYQPDPRR
jgi:molybdate transport system substrate-binding protein